MIRPRHRSHKRGTAIRAGLSVARTLVIIVVVVVAWLETFPAGSIGPSNDGKRVPSRD